MVILDVFEHSGKTAIYCKTEGEVNKQELKKVAINGKYYNVLKKDIMHSISGDIAVTLLLDTNEKIPIHQTVTTS